MDDFSLPENLAALAVEDIQELIEAAREEFHALNDSDSLEDETLDRMTELADAIDSLHDEFVSKVELAISRRDEISAKVFGNTTPTFAKKDEVPVADEDEAADEAEEDPEEEATETPDEEASEEADEDETDEKKKAFPGAAKPFGAAGETEEFASEKQIAARKKFLDLIKAKKAKADPSTEMSIEDEDLLSEEDEVFLSFIDSLLAQDTDTEELASEDTGPVTKSEVDGHYPASDYAYVPDAMSPSTWKLRLTSSPGGDPDARIVGAAVAALGKGFRGNKVQIPAEDLGKVKAKVRAAWLKANPDKSSDDLPSVLR